MLNEIVLKYNINSVTYDLIEKTIPKQPKENYYGNREYKYKITNLSKSKLEKRSTQCLFRIMEGNGNASYFIGVDDNGNILGISESDINESLENLLKIIINIDAKLVKLKLYKLYDKDLYYMFIKIKKDVIY